MDTGNRKLEIGNEISLLSTLYSVLYTLYYVLCTSAKDIKRFFGGKDDKIINDNNRCNRFVV